MSVYSSDSASRLPTTSGSAGAASSLSSTADFGHARREDGAEDLVGVVEDGDVVGRLQVGDAGHVAHVERLDVQREVLGDVGRQGAHRDLAGDDVEQAAVQADADGRALEGHGDVRLDGLGELDLLEVDVGHDVLDLVELELLDDRHVRRLWPSIMTSSTACMPASGADRVAQGVLVDGDAHRRLARAVQHGRDEAAAAQTAGLAAAGDVAGVYDELDSIH